MVSDAIAVSAQPRKVQSSQSVRVAAGSVIPFAVVSVIDDGVQVPVPALKVTVYGTFQWA